MLKVPEFTKIFPKLSVSVSSGEDLTASPFFVVILKDG